jgi:hypothetical protein
MSPLLSEGVGHVEDAECQQCDRPLSRLGEPDSPEDHRRQHAATPLQVADAGEFIEAMEKDYQGYLASK